MFKKIFSALGAIGWGRVILIAGVICFGVLFLYERHRSIEMEGQNLLLSQVLASEIDNSYAKVQELDSLLTAADRKIGNQAILLGEYELAAIPETSIVTDTIFIFRQDSIRMPLNGETGLLSYEGMAEFNLIRAIGTHQLIFNLKPILLKSQVLRDKEGKWFVRAVSASPKIFLKNADIYIDPDVFLSNRPIPDPPKLPTFLVYPIVELEKNWDGSKVRADVGFYTKWKGLRLHLMVRSIRTSYQFGRIWPRK